MRGTGPRKIGTKIEKYARDPDIIAKPSDKDDIDAVLKHVANIFKEINNLILREECASGQEIQNRTSEEAKRGFSARHYGLFTIVVTIS